LGAKSGRRRLTGLDGLLYSLPQKIPFVNKGREKGAYAIINMPAGAPPALSKGFAALILCWI